MTEHDYKKGRLNFPFVGICTFRKYPYHPDYDITTSTTTLAAQLLLNSIGRILHHK